MSDSRKSWISLCQVNRPDRNGDIWLKRLADVQTGMLVPFEVNKDKPQTSENRYLIFHQDGPQDTDVLGFWQWTDEEDEDGHWRTSSSFLADNLPIEVVTLDHVENVQDIVAQLKKGIYIPLHVQGMVMFSTHGQPRAYGVLCNMNDFEINSHSKDCRFVKFKDTVHVLPYYTFRNSDIFTWKERKIYKYTSLRNEHSNILVHTPAEAIKHMVLQHMRWPIFKAQGISKSDWRKFIDFLNAIPKSSIYDELENSYGMSYPSAKQCIDTFFQNVQSYIDVTDLDSEMFLQIFKNHAAVRKQCEEVSEAQWRGEHQAEIAAAQQEVDNLRQNAALELQKESDRLEDLKAQELVAETRKAALLEEVAQTQDKLNSLIEKCAQYEALGTDALAAVRSKISEAQKDMAGFLADMSIFMPQTMLGQYGNTSSPDDTWNFIEGTPYNVGVEEDASICKDWEDTIVILKENLRIAGVGERWLRPLSAYLYSAYINQVDLLLAGPNGEEIANAFSIAVSGNQASKIVCAGKMSSQAVQLANDSSASVVTVENPFHPDWISHIPHYSRQPKIKKQMHIWVHPFMEDLSLEPAGLYNYVLPVFTEVFIEQAPVQQAYSVSRNNPEYVQFTSTRSNPAHANLIKNLGVSKLQVEKLRRVIRDAKEIANIINLDIEYLFGVLPLSILLDKKDFLQEALGGEKNLSAAVRKEIQRYVDGE